MASIVKLGKGKQPPRAIDFKNTTGKRDRVRLGIVTHDVATEARRRIEKLLEAKRLNHPPDRPTLEWLAGVSDEIHERLARFGLCKPHVPKDAAPTLGKWLEKYIEQRKTELKTGSVERLQQTADKLLAFFGADIRLDSLTPDGAADWRAAMATELKPLKKGEKSSTPNRGLRYAEGTVRNAARDAKTIFNAAVERELLARNPFSKLKSGVLKKTRIGYVTLEESRLILASCPSADWKVLFGLARFAGLRTPSETHWLTWDKVNLETRRLEVYSPKTNTDRIVPITPELSEVLIDALKASPDKSGKVVRLGAHRSNLHRGLRKIINLAGILAWKDLFQVLRCCAETDFKKKVPNAEACKYIGHSPAVSEKHYGMESLEMDAVAFPREELRAAESAAVGSRTSSQVQETRRNDDEAGTTMPAPKNAENPCKSGVFDSSKGGTRTRDPRLMKPVL